MVSTLYPVLPFVVLLLEREVRMALCPSGQGVGLELRWALPAQVRTLSVSLFRERFGVSDLATGFAESVFTPRGGCLV